MKTMKMNATGILEVSVKLGMLQSALNLMDEAAKKGNHKEVKRLLAEYKGLAKDASDVLADSVID